MTLDLFPRTKSPARRRPLTSEDARILRGAEILRQQLIRDTVSSYEEAEQKQQQQQQQQQVEEVVTESPSTPEEIARETARIQADLLRTGRPPRGSSVRSLTPSRRRKSTPRRTRHVDPLDLFQQQSSAASSSFSSAVTPGEQTSWASHEILGDLNMSPIPSAVLHLSDERVPPPKDQMPPPPKYPSAYTSNNNDNTSEPRRSRSLMCSVITSSKDRHRASCDSSIKSSVRSSLGPLTNNSLNCSLNGRQQPEEMEKPSTIEVARVSGRSHNRPNGGFEVAPTTLRMNSKDRRSELQKKSIVEGLIKGTASDSVLGSHFSSSNSKCTSAKSAAKSTRSSCSSRSSRHKGEEFNPFVANVDAIEVVDMVNRRGQNTSFLDDFSLLLQDPAFLHAQKAGFLWQSLVGAHIRFPSRWWKGLNGPPLNINEQGENLPPWFHVACVPVRHHKGLKRLVKNRAAAGRLLLHIMVQDTVIHKPVCDIVIGCYHPNARGIRTSEAFAPELEQTRSIWMAVRKRTPWSVTVLDRWLAPHPDLKTPIGKQNISNRNVRVVYGERPPVETLMLPERDLYEKLNSASSATSPALVLLDSFVFNA